MATFPLKITIEPARTNALESLISKKAEAVKVLDKIMIPNIRVKNLSLRMKHFHHFLEIRNSVNTTII